MKLLPPSERIFKPLVVLEKILMGPGPTNASCAILDACKLPMLGPVDPELLQVKLLIQLQFFYQIEHFVVQQSSIFCI